MKRRLCSAILLLEAIVLGLSSIVWVQLTSLSIGEGLGLGLGLAAACLVTSGLLRMPWAYGLGWLIQFAAIGLGFLEGSMFVLGVIFLALWATAVRVGVRIEADRARWAAEGR